MNKSSHRTPHRRIDEALEDSFPASDPPAWNMGADRTPEAGTAKRPASRPAAAAQPRVARSRQRKRGAASRRRAAPGARRLAATARQRNRHSAFPGGWRLLSPFAWLGWLLQRGIRPADEQL